MPGTAALVKEMRNGMEDIPSVLLESRSSQHSIFRYGKSG